MFADIELLAKQCKLKDCQHQTEPGCAVLKALEADELDQRRLTNFQLMLKEQARNSMTISESHPQDKASGKLIKNSMQHKKLRNHQ